MLTPVSPIALQRPEIYIDSHLTATDYHDSIDYSNSLRGAKMDIKLFDSEIKLMEIIWKRKSISAREVSLIAAESIGWNKNTTYTVLKKLEAKGYIRRDDPGFICTPLISRDEVRSSETRGLINKLFGGSKKALFSALLQDEDLTQEELNELRDMIEKR